MPERPAALTTALKAEKDLRSSLDVGPIESCRQIAEVLGKRDTLLQDGEKNMLDFVNDLVKELATETAEIDDSITVMLSAVKDIEKRVVQIAAAREGAEIETATDFDAIFAEELAKAKGAAKSDPEQNEKYKKIMSYLPQNEDDDEMEVLNDRGGGSSGADLKCPFTAKWFVEPVQNKACGHVYSKAAVDDYIKFKKRERKPIDCPVAGCRHRIVETELKLHGTTVDALRVRAMVETQTQGAEADNGALSVDEDEETESAVYEM